MLASVRTWCKLQQHEVEYENMEYKRTAYHRKEDLSGADPTHGKLHEKHTGIRPKCLVIKSALTRISVSLNHLIEWKY